MRTSDSGFTWGHKQARAARRVAEDLLTDREIALECAVHVATLERWKQVPEFAAVVARIRAGIAAAELVGGIAHRPYRVQKLQGRQQALEQVIEERAADPAMRKVPGGTTGLVVRKYRRLGLGKDAQTVEEYAVDTGTLAELREIEKQAAIELGQWTEKRELAGKDGAPIMVIEVAGPAAAAPETEPPDAGA